MKQNRSAYLMALLCFILTSCKGPLGRLLDQIDNAIEQVEKTRVSVIHESQNWRRGIFELEENISDDVSNIIKEDIRKMGLDLIYDAGAESRCEIEFVESKLISYLDAVLTALKEIRVRAEEEGGLEESLEIILSHMIDKRGVLMPYACHNDSFQINCEQNGVSLKPIGDPIATIMGYGFSGSLDKYRIQLLDLDDNIIDSLSGRRYLSNPTPYKLAVRLEDISLNREHKKLRILWNEWMVSEFIIRIEKEKEALTKPELVVLKYIIRPIASKSERISLNIETVINSISLPDSKIDEVGRGKIYFGGDKVEVPSLGVFINMAEVESVLVRIEMEKLDEAGDLVKKVDLKKWRMSQQLLTNNWPMPWSEKAYIAAHLKKGYVQEGSDLKLYKYPPTLIQDWSGFIEPVWLVGNKERRFAPVEFKFENNVNVVTAKWTLDGVAIE